MALRHVYFDEDGPDSAVMFEKPGTAHYSDEDLYEVPDEVAAAFETAAKAWDDAQEVTRAWFKEESEKYAPHQVALEEWFTDNITKAQFEARVAGCTHPDRWRGYGEFGVCVACGAYSS